MMPDFQGASLRRSAADALTLVKVRQAFQRPVLRDLEQAVRSQIKQSGVEFPPGGDIAIAVGSRGIANIAQITRAVASHIREAGAKPFIVPAMGSHGGATAEGQCELLASFGITEQSVGCSIRSAMDVASLPNEGLPHPLYMDQHAFKSAGVVLINRIKPHTDFHGRYESGLTKMAVIGLGKERQAFEMHRFGVHGLRDLVPKAAERVFATNRILLGIGLVENAYEETARLEAIPGREILSREPALLEAARANMPRLPVGELDLLIVDQLGKNISGTGLDTNIIGRIRIPGEQEPAEPRIKSIVVAGLTPETKGNATGLGLADVITQRLLEQTDFAVTYCNIVTSGFLERAKIPIVAATDADAVEIALRSAGPHSRGQERVIRIRDTLHLDEIYVSKALLKEITPKKDIQVLNEVSLLENSRFAPF